MCLLSLELGLISQSSTTAPMPTKRGGGVGGASKGLTKRRNSQDVVLRDMRGRKLCEHGRLKSKCKDCGTGYCEHGRQKSQCKDCGTGYCEHGRQKSLCKDCGTGYCEHGRQRSQCKDCGTGRYKKVSSAAKRGAQSSSARRQRSQKRRRQTSTAERATPSDEPTFVISGMEVQATNVGLGSSLDELRNGKWEFAEI